MLLFDDSKKLEKALGEEAATVLAHVLEKADEKNKQELEKVRQGLATRSDLEKGLVLTKNELIVEIEKIKASLQVEMQAMKNDLTRWMVGLIVALGAFIVAAMAVMK